MRVIDLSLPIYNGMDVYPGDPQVAIEPVHAYASHTWLLRRIEMGSHTGTHVDAPSHMHEGAPSLDELPLERFCGRARLARSGEPDRWPAGRGLLFAEAVGLDSLARLAELRPPFVGGELSEELERALLGIGVITYTGLCRLERLPPDADFLFFGLPLPFKEGDGSPVRAVAVLDIE